MKYLFLATLIMFSAFYVKAQNTRVKGKILYICRMDYRDKVIDDQVKHRLDSLGYSVSFADSDEPVSRSAGFDLIVISSTVSSQKFAGKYAGVTIPVMMWENDIQDDMRYTGRYKGVDFGEIGGDVKGEHYIWVVNAPHPLAAGIAAGTNVVYRKDQPMGWGKPGLGASIIATLPGQPDKAIIYGYEKGATMDYDFLAPARRVMFFLDNTTFPMLTDQGLALFDAAIAWSIRK